MATIELTPEVLRTLGEGVARLEDGDTEDCSKALAVREEMGRQGYEYTSYDFMSKDRILVTSYTCTVGADFGKLSESALALVCGQVEGAVSLDGISYSQLKTLNEDTITRMARIIRTEVGQ